MADSFNQRYPNGGLPLQGAAQQLSKPATYGQPAGKPPLVNGQNYPTQNNSQVFGTQPPRPSPIPYGVPQSMSGPQPGYQPGQPQGSPYNGQGNGPPHPYGASPYSTGQQVPQGPSSGPRPLSQPPMVRPGQPPSSGPTSITPRPLGATNPPVGFPSGGPARLPGPTGLPPPPQSQASIRPGYQSPPLATGPQQVPPPSNMSGRPPGQFPPPSTRPPGPYLANQLPPQTSQSQLPPSGSPYSQQGRNHLPGPNIQAPLGPQSHPPLGPPGQQGHQLPGPQGHQLLGPQGHQPPGPQAHQPPGSYPGQYPGSQQGLVQGMERMSVAQQGFNKLWGSETVDLLQCRNILPPQRVSPPPIRLPHEFMNSVNCSQDIFCCTLNKIPETNNLLQKSRLPLGVLIHPFRDLTELPVIQCSSIVRCRSCRTYINPFVYFVDNKRWKCNLCFRVNELPDEFQFDPVSRTYGDPSRRPEIKSCTIEFIAPSEYMLRPPQPAIYLFLLEASRWGCDSGYLRTVCDTLAEELDSLPGDARTQVGFLLFDSYLHFFSVPDGASQAKELIITDIDDVFLPMPDSLLVNLNEKKTAVRELLAELPKRFAESFDVGCALGPALQVAHKLMAPTGGRVTLFQCSLPNRGPGALVSRETASNDSEKDGTRLNPQTDFYKRLALECSSQQIAVDVYLLNSMHSDLATVAGISQFSGGCVQHIPGYRVENVALTERLTRSLRRYLTRKIGFEAVMRVRCSRGLAIHTFHGNFFVRSTDLLSLPNINPDAGFGMQVTIEDSLSELHSVCFQAALLYTSAKGERRIRVHTVCLPVSPNLPEIMASANQQAIIALLAKMAVDRSLKTSLSDAREAFINACIDMLSTYKTIDGSHSPGLVAPTNLALVPLYILALLKSVAFRSGSTTRLDDRMFAMLQMKNLPLKELIQMIHPDLFHVTTLEDEPDGSNGVITPPRLGLSLQYVDSRGVYLLDTPEAMYLLVGSSVAPEYLQDVLGAKNGQCLAQITEIPDVDTADNDRLRTLVNQLQLEKSYPVVLRVLTEQRDYATLFINDKSENAFSYHELLNHIKTHVK